MNRNALMTLRLAATACCLLMLAPPDADARRIKLKTHAGAMQAGGQISLNITNISPKEGDSRSGYTLTLAPDFAYFVANNFAIDFGLAFQTHFGDLFENAGQTFGFRIGGRYIIALDGPVRPYLGARIGLDMNIPNEGDTAKTLVTVIPLGVLFPLFTEHVALDVGLRIRIEHSLEDDETTTLRVPIGYLGIQAFFGK